MFCVFKRPETEIFDSGSGRKRILRLLPYIVFCISAGLLGGDFLVRAFGYLPAVPGQMTFILFIVAIFYLVYARSWSMIRLAWIEKKWKWISLLAGVGYAVFYILATNMVSTPDPDSPPPPSFGYLVPAQVYGPLAPWPDIEFWSPRIGLFGYFSVGSVLLVLTLGLLMSFAIALLSQSIRSRRNSLSKGGVGAYLGSFVLSFATNTCCCCSPVLLPLLAALFGSGTADYLQLTLGPGTVFSDLLAIANIALLLGGILISTKQIATCKTLQT